MEPDGFLPDGTPVYFKFGRGGCNSTEQLELYSRLMNPKYCTDCGHFYQEFKSGVYCCSAGHNDIVGRHRKVCKDVKED